MPTPVDIQNGVAPALMQGDRDFSAVRCILDCVFNDVIADLRQLAGIGKHLAVIFNMRFNLLLSLFRQRRQAGNRLPDRVGKDHHFPTQAQFVAVDMHQRQQVADDRGQPVDFLVDI